MSKFSNFAGHRVWVITGAASGIGLEMVRALIECRAIVWALDMDEAALKTLSTEAAQGGHDVFTRVVDVTDHMRVLEIISEIVKNSRRIDVWINNAGIQKIGPFSTQSPELFNQIMRVNYDSVVNISRAMIQQMDHQGGGVILNMASVAGHVPCPFMTAYVASKHAVIGFSRALRAELFLLKSPVRCAVASPGFVNTGIIERGRESGFPEWLSWLLANPRDCARETLAELADGNDDIEPTLGGRAMTTAFRWVPVMTVKSSRVLLTRGLRDIFLNRYHVPKG
jgi:short-subunit dehydrogenase